MKGGVGTASVYLGNGIYVGAIVVVNSAGSPVNPADCRLWGAQFGLGDEFKGLATPTAAECHPLPANGSDDLNATIAVVLTNAPLEKAAAERMAAMHTTEWPGRSTRSIHWPTATPYSRCRPAAETPLRVNDPAAGSMLNAVFNAGASTLSRAIAKAVLSAETVGQQELLRSIPIGLPETGRPAGLADQR
jgi:L-aminopeptidase/D-esterase-like protein